MAESLKSNFTPKTRDSNNQLYFESIWSIKLCIVTLKIIFTHFLFVKMYQFKYQYLYCSKIIVLTLFYSNDNTISTWTIAIFNSYLIPMITSHFSMMISLL